MRLVIAGPRNLYPDDEIISRGIDQVVEGSGLLVSKIITGSTSGVDACARRYALRHNISTREFEKDNKKYGQSAEAIRDSRMLDHGDALLVFTRQWLRTRRGQALLEMAEKRGTPVYMEDVEG